MKTIDDALKYADTFDSPRNQHMSIVILAAEVRRLQAELEQERKRLDWALANDAQYFMWDGEMTFCCSLDEGCGMYTFVRESEDPRAEIDEFISESKKCEI